ncbi:Thermolabile hemolysin [Mycena venus]|uniref:Thermolabile hemolysin n=1 Tax=Mycena venus TaxID=2733690 RepID=A0A8H6Z1R6_9AGAR|nr:Thermolabile hemolysin [Mycena venus]
MASQFPSTVLRTSQSWKGFDALKFFVVFGASYCDIGYEYTTSPAPSEGRPLGVEFPGDTYAETGEPNWVGHLITKYGPKTKSLVYDYAKGGSRVYNVRNQIQVMFNQHIGRKPAWAPWTAEDTLFITWVGINDAAFGSEHEDNLKKLFEAQESLYLSGARNFLFVNVPPIHRSPSRGKEINYENWNTELQKAAVLFAEVHPDTTVMIYSSWDTFNALLDDPVAHGFPAQDVNKENGSIWMDVLHPTSKVHDLVARDMSTFLSAQAALEG